MTLTSAAQLAKTLGATALLEAEQNREVRTLAGKVGDARALAQELLRRDWLTPYQVNRLLQGRGDQLALGPYILLERLGEGGMGQVFKARQRNLHRVVALKVIRKECLGNPKVIQRFQREIRAAGQLSHPNIVRAYDADQVSGTWYIALEYIDGIDLARLVRERGPLPVAMACDYIRQAALGLQHAHERGMVHRDIKPANLLVARGVSGGSSGKIPLPDRKALGGHGEPRDRIGPGCWGAVKILDMGLARWSDPETGRSCTHLTQMGSIMGTPDFIAPEQARNSHTSDIRADIYSLGCTFFWLLTGRVPFPAGGLTERLLAHQFEKPPRAGEVRRVTFLERNGSLQFDAKAASVPAEVQAVLDLLLAKKPEDRPQTPTEVVEILTGLTAGLSGDAAPLEAPGSAPTAGNVADPTLRGEGKGEPVRSSSPHPDLAVGRSSTSMMGSVIVALPRFLGRSKRRVLGSPGKSAVLVLVGSALVLGMVLGLGNRDRPAAAVSKEVVDLGPVLSAEEKEWKHLQGRAANPAADAPGLRADLARFRARVFNRPVAADVTRVLAGMASPFDRFDRSKIERKFVYAWWPEEIAGVVIPPRTLFEPRGSMRVLAVSPDGNHLAAAGEGGPLRVWNPNATSGMPFRYEAGNIRCLRFSPDGRWLGVGTEDGTSSLREAGNRELVHGLDGGGSAIVALAFHPSGEMLATAERKGPIRVWKTAKGEPVHTYDSRVGEPRVVTYHPGGKTLFWGGSNHEVRWVDLVTNKVCSEPLRGEAEIGALCFHPGGSTGFLGCGDGTVIHCTWDGKELKGGDGMKVHRGGVNGLEISPDGRWCVSIGAGGQAALWEGATGKHVRTWELRWPIHAVAWAPDCRHFVTANGNGSLFVWRLESPVVPLAVEGGSTSQLSRFKRPVHDFAE